MDIGQITASSTTSSIVPEQKKSVVSSDFETFLKMLTAQVQNQDPLNPIDSSDFAVQLATFSSVEQQVLTNDRLLDIGDKIGATGLAQLANWVGMETRVVAPAYFEGSPITLAISTPTNTDQNILVVRNDVGVTVARTEIPVSVGAFEWAGVGENGMPFADGVYSFSLESFSEGKSIESDPIEVFTRVTELRYERDGTILVLQGGGTVNANLVTGLRKPRV